MDITCPIPKLQLREYQFFRYDGHSCQIIYCHRTLLLSLSDKFHLCKPIIFLYLKYLPHQSSSHLLFHNQSLSASRHYPIQKIIKTFAYIAKSMIDSTSRTPRLTCSTLCPLAIPGGFKCRKRNISFLIHFLLIQIPTCLEIVLQTLLNITILTPKSGILNPASSYFYMFFFNYLNYLHLSKPQFS